MRHLLKDEQLSGKSRDCYADATRDLTDAVTSCNLVDKGGGVLTEQAGHNQIGAAPLLISLPFGICKHLPHQWLCSLM